ncbi:hypothetical protein HY441_02105 [Candidatus Microgenomates bacterium]|nr:hypothetical protein [Candidatus Microgenomates bacterium]
MGKNKSFQELLDQGPTEMSENGAGLSITYTAPEDKLPKLRELYAAAMAANEISTSTYQVAQAVADRFSARVNTVAELVGIAEGTPFNFDIETGVFTVSFGG